MQCAPDSNGAIEGPHGHLKSAIRDALLLRGTSQFDDLADYRRFIEEILARKNLRNAGRIDAERASPREIPSRTCTPSCRAASRHRQDVPSIALANNNTTWHDCRAATPPINLIVACSHAECRATGGKERSGLHG